MMADITMFGRWMRTFPYRQPVDRVEILPAGGEVELRPTFLHQPAELFYDDHGYEHLRTVGKPVYAVRYTPTKAGLHRYRAFTGEKVMEEGGFHCASSDHEGYVVTRSDSPRYLLTTHGKGYVPIGPCMVGPPSYPLPAGSEHFETSESTATLGAAEYQRWFRLLSENGGNYARIWLSHPYFNVETEVAGELNLGAFARLDAVIEHARTHGIRLKLCFEHFRTFTQGRPFYKELRHPDDGRAPESIDAWLTEPTWRELWLKKVKAYTDRYGDDPVVMAWELWNEMDCVAGDFDLVRAWTEDMLKEVRKLAPEHLVTNSLGSFDSETKIDMQNGFHFPEMSIDQVHRYLDQGAPWEICREDPVALSIDAVRRTARLDRPLLLAETGAVNDRHTGPFRYYRMDNRGIIFHDTTFPAFFTGAAGTGHIWHWDHYVDQKNLWRHYRIFAELVEGLDLGFERFMPFDLSNDTTWFRGLRGRRSTLAWVRNRADTWHAVLRDGKEPPLVEEQVFDLTQFQIQEGAVRLFWPWGDEPDEVAGGEATFSEGQLHLPPFRYCLMVGIGPKFKTDPGV
jgi:hypothetical protein